MGKTGRITSCMFLSRAPVDMGHGRSLLQNVEKLLYYCALLVWKLGPREAENGPKLSSTMYHLYVITVQYACSSRPSTEEVGTDHVSDHALRFSSDVFMERMYRLSFCRN